ncbi:unnamed protein product [Enterobius vermicularis]|uniref:Peptidase M10 metallopeptidase domain-containing protein n=1 Tax=Enterobius vermicularis TaxID=51028 RepID=A0A3P6IJD3_ENTVE|nr:unnamed protein product [Enterobius vermicularis]
MPYSAGEKFLHFDDDELWTIKDTTQLRDYTDLHYVAIHEIGHVLGLDHSSDQNSIMAPYYQDPLDKFGNYQDPKLGEDDIKKIQELYGEFNMHKIL